MTIGESARKAREAAGLSRAKLSDLSGVPQTTIYNIEHDRRVPSVLNAEALARALQISIENYIAAAPSEDEGQRRKGKK